jgi:acetolactate synthase-1/2/3 large subunit
VPKPAIEPSPAPAQIKHTVAMALLETLRKRGVKQVFANAGTDFAPVIEGLVALDKLAVKAPNFYAIPHENLAVAMAHGYYAMCGRPPVVMVHTTVGTANAIMGLKNASRDHIPLVLLAGRTPLTQEGHVASRNAHIHWGQESFDQGGMLREYVKWDYELHNGQPVDEVVGRAIDIAYSHPRGPVYLTLPREVLADQVQPRADTRFAVPAKPPVPATTAIEAAAALLAQAEHPLIITSYLGQDVAAVPILEQFAEDFAIPVAQQIPRYVNIRASHPMNVGSVDGWLQEADVVLVIDCEMPWLPSRVQPKSDAKIMHLGLDPLHHRYPYRSFPADLGIEGSPISGLRMLSDALAGRAQGGPAVDARRAKARAHRDAQQRRLAETVEDIKNLEPIAPAWMGACVADVLPANAIIINELGAPTDLLALEQPGTFMNAGMAGGLGFALGGALGAKLAAPDRLVVAIVGNGSYMFGNPTPFHYVAKALDLPILTVIQNNSRWQAVDEATRSVYPAGEAVAASVMPLVDLSPSPDFSLVAKASGAHAEVVTEPALLPDALQRAVAAVYNGQQALLDVRTGVAGPRQA